MLHFMTTTELPPTGPIAILHRSDTGTMLVVMNSRITDSALRCEAINRLLAAVPERAA